MASLFTASDTTPDALQDSAQTRQRKKNPPWMTAFEQHSKLVQRNINSKLMNEGENPRHAVKRGIAEELGENYSRNIRFFKGPPGTDIDKVDINEEGSNSYPGLPAQYRWYREEAYIPNLTNDTLYTPKKQFFHEELKDDGTFKRNILWQWRKTNNL